MERLSRYHRRDEGSRERPGPRGDRADWDRVPGESFRSVRAGTVPTRWDLRRHERRRGRDPEERRGGRLDGPRDRIERAGGPAAVRPRRDGQSRHVVRPTVSGSGRVLRGGHDPNLGAGLRCHLGGGPRRLGNRAGGRECHRDAGRSRGNVARLDRHGLRNPDAGQRPPGARRRCRDRDLSGPLAPARGDRECEDPCERPNDSRCERNGHRLDDGHGPVDDRRAGDDGSAVRHERRLPSVRREWVRSPNGTHDHADGPPPRDAVLPRGHVPRAARERDHGYERGSRLPIPDVRDGRCPPRRGRRLIPSRARGIVRGRARRQRVDLVPVARRGTRPASARDPSSAPRGHLASRIGAVPAVQCVRADVGAELSRRRRSSHRLLARLRVGPWQHLVPVRDRANGGVGPSRTQGDLCL